MNNSERFFGCHISAAGGLHEALKRAEALSINTIQVHASPPQKWNSQPCAPGVELEYLARLPKSIVKKVFFHGIYLINLATPDPQKQHLAKLSLVNSLDFLGRIGGDGLIFHVGSLKDEPDEAEGFKRAAYCINWILEHARNDAKLVLEVAAGSGSIIGDRFEELAAIYDQVEDKSRVMFALDTQHLWASGYDLRTEFDSLLSTIDNSVGLSKVAAIHFNDSKSELGSRIDRHENIGEGKIGKETLFSLFKHPKVSSIPFILETPALKTEDGARQQVELLRSWHAL